MMMMMMIIIIIIIITSFGSSIQPPADPEDGHGIISRNVEKPHFDAAVCSRKFYFSKVDYEIPCYQ